jgi:predicted  nucleic acid-binding Zn-ribbon protein
MGEAQQDAANKDTELASAHEKEVQLEADLQALQDAHTNEQEKVADLRRTHEALEKTINVACKALKHVQDYPLAQDEMNQAKGAVLFSWLGP